MFKQGRKRESKGLAVVYFIIGLIILLIILAVIYFALVELDYSDRIKDPDATIRSYVEMTPDPNALDIDAGFDEDADENPLDVDLTAPTETPEPTPTPSPTPTPTPEPTPTPTPLPPTTLAQARTSGFSLPQATTSDCKAAITKCYVSVGDNNRYMYLAGYGYINEANFDGASAQSFLVVSQASTNQLIAYQLNMRAGISGVTHGDALCKNAANCDFEVTFDVSQLYTDDTYLMGLVVGYKPGNKKKATYYYYPFPSNISFTVQGGQVVAPVPVSGEAVAETPGIITAPGTVGADGTVYTGFDTSEPEDLSPLPTPNTGVYDPSIVGVASNTAADPFGVAQPTQQPTLDNAQQTLQDTAAIQEQIFQNQMGVG